MTNKIYIFTVLLIICVSPLFGLNTCHGSNGRSTEGPWLGLVGPMTGKHQAYGESMAKGAQLAISELNQDSSYPPIQLIILDDQNDEQQAGARANQFVQEKN